MMRMSTKALKRALTQDRLVLGGYALPTPLRLILGFFFCVAFAISWGALNINSSGSKDMHAVAIGTAVVLAALFYLTVFWIDRLALNLHTRTYVREYGCYPFVKRRNGALNEFAHLNLSLEPFEYKGERGSTFIYHLWCLRLASNAKGPPADDATVVAFSDYSKISAWGCPDRDVMQPLAESLADRIGLPLAIGGIITKRK